MSEKNETLKDDTVKLDDCALFTNYIVSREEAAFAELVERYETFAFRVAFAVCGVRSLAEEAAQEGFIILARERNPMVLQKYKSFRAFFYGVVWNAAANVARSERRAASKIQGHYRETVDMRHREEMKAASDTDISRDEGPASINTLAKELENLRAEHRLPIILHFLEGMSQTEVGKLLGVSQSQVARRIASGIETLRLRLSQAKVSLSAAGVAALLKERGILTPSPGFKATLIDALRLSSESLRIVGAKSATTSTLWKVAAVTAVCISATGAGIWKCQSSNSLPAPKAYHGDPESAQPVAISSPASEQISDLSWKFETPNDQNDFEVIEGSWEFRRDANGLGYMEIPGPRFVARIKPKTPSFPISATIKTECTDKGDSGRKLTVSLGWDRVEMVALFHNLFRPSEDRKTTMHVFTDGKVFLNWVDSSKSFINISLPQKEASLCIFVQGKYQIRNFTIQRTSVDPRSNDQELIRIFDAFHKIDFPNRVGTVQLPSITSFSTPQLATVQFIYYGGKNPDDWMKQGFGPLSAK